MSILQDGERVRVASGLAANRTEGNRLGGTAAGIKEVIDVVKVLEDAQVSAVEDTALGDVRVCELAVGCVGADITIDTGCDTFVAECDEHTRLEGQGVSKADFRGAARKE